MVRNDKSLLRVVVFAVATAAASACAPLDTDVVDTSTERVGDDSIVAERDADALYANVGGVGVAMATTSPTRR